MFKAAEFSPFRIPLAKAGKRWRAARSDAVRGSPVHAVHSFGHPEPPGYNIGWGDFGQCMHVKYGQGRWSKAAVEKSQLVIMKDGVLASQCSEVGPAAVALLPLKVPGYYVAVQGSARETVLKVEHLDSVAFDQDGKSGFDRAFETQLTNKAD